MGADWNNSEWDNKKDWDSGASTTNDWGKDWNADKKEDSADDSWGAKKSADDSWGASKKDDDAWGTSDAKDDGWGASGKTDSWDDGDTGKDDKEWDWKKGGGEKEERFKNAPEGKETFFDSNIAEALKKEAASGEQEVEKAMDDDVHIVANPSNVAIETWKTWDQVAFPPDLVDIMRQQFEKPTLIQSYVWPLATFEEDVIGVAKTGSGKTLAFLIPCFIKIKVAEAQDGYDPAPGQKTPLALVVTPTRELAIQIFKEAEKFGVPAGIRTCLVYGGANNSKDQLFDLDSKGPHILCGTPGRLAAWCEDEKFDLSQLAYFVLDEADRLLDMGFEWEIRMLIGKAPEKRQSLLFSATMPLALRVLARRFTFRDCLHLQIGTDDAMTGNADIVQEVMFVKTERDKSDALWDLIKEELRDENSKVLIFCQSKAKCASLCSDASYYGEIQAVEMHGDLEQKTREWNMDQFRDGTTRVMFATDVCSRGLDVEGIALVINFHVAESATTHTHRIGRTGRAGKKGRALTMMDEDELYFCWEIVQTMKKAGQNVPHDLAAKARENKRAWNAGA